MKFLKWRSIRTQIMASTTLLIVALVVAIVTIWVKSVSKLYLQEKLDQGKSFSEFLSYSLVNELGESNWSQIRMNIDKIMKEDSDFVYVIVSDARQDNQIIASSTSEFQGEYIPDFVPLSITNKALNLNQKVSITETFILRDVYFHKHLRARRGDRVLEISSNIYLISGEKIGNVRLGMSLKQIDQAVSNTVNQVLKVGAVGLIIGWIFAYILAERLSYPVRSLQASAAKIADGDLRHRAEIRRKDEIGALANSFNEMSGALQISFGKLQKTLESFERFVPNKFVSVIAPQGIENIQVGVASIRKMTILFSDIRGYTSMSEALSPLEIFTFLNDYLACMGQAIDLAGGFIDKYIGDAIMALFDDEATDGALQAAILMHQALDIFNYERSQKGLPKIAVGIGIHRGEVVMGTVGFTSRIDSTVIGDAVNVASRIEGLTKQYGCPILVTESVVNSLEHPELFCLRLVDKSVKVKGKDTAIAIYELQVN
ncbi:MAG TPA: adenylate/guanylate cyclase domain-containing protein [Nostocaceae cyanobacterium]|nr:adenylate/guanylate cyclase domain-containing protein [Nostocaceae cyanobacterium]